MAAQHVWGKKYAIINTIGERNNNPCIFRRNGVVVAQTRLVLGTEYECTAKTLVHPGSLAPIASTSNVNITSGKRCSHYCNTGFFTEIASNFIYTGVLSNLMYNMIMVNDPPVGSSCVAIDHDCADVINTNNPINRLSIALGGSTAQKEYMFKGTKCVDSVGCAVIAGYFALINNEILENWIITTLQSTEYACLLSYMGYGEFKENNPCYDQLGDRCYDAPYWPRICISTFKKPIGITNYKDQKYERDLYCHLDGAAEDRTNPYNLPLSKSVHSYYTYCKHIIFLEARWQQDGKTKFYTVMTRTRDRDVFNRLRAAGVQNLYINAGWRLVSHGMWNGMLASTESQNAWISSIVRYIKDYNLNGLELTWIPKEQYVSKWYTFITLFEQRMKADLPSARLILRVSVHHPNYLYYNLAVTEKVFDKIIIDSLNTVGRYCPAAWEHSTNICGGDSVCVKSSQYTTRVPVEYITSHVPASKLIYSLPFYGNVWVKQGTNWIPIAQLGKHTERLGQMSYYELQVKHNPSCIVDPVALCCKSLFKAGTTDILALWHSIGQLEKRMTFVATKYSITQFDIQSIDQDEAVPRGLQRISKYMNDIPFITNKQGGLLTYQIGTTSPAVYCPNILITLGNIVITATKYKEFSSLNRFSGLYIAKVDTLKACTPGEPLTKVRESTILPQRPIDINTLLYTKSKATFCMGLDLNGNLIDFAPSAVKPCLEINADNITRLPYVEIDSEYIFSEPIEKDGAILISQGLHHIVSDFRLVVDYINFNTQCMNFNVSYLPSCIATACAAEPNCMKTYGSLCSSADIIIKDADRSSKLLVNAFEDYELEHRKAQVYRDVPATTPDEKFFGVVALGVATGAAITAGAAIVIAKKTEYKVDILSAQLDATHEYIEKLGDTVVAISTKLDRNLQMTNQRIDQIQQQLNDNFQIISTNFASLSSELNELSTIVNANFKVTFGYQSWYQHMTSLTFKLTQAAIQMNYKTARVRDCLKSLSDGTMTACPSGARVLLNDPGIGFMKTVQALLYINKKLIIVNSLPHKIMPIVAAKAIPFPILRNGIVCWPNYDLQYVEGLFTLPLNCVGRYCYKPVEDMAYKACRANVTKCTLICTPCFKGICFNNGTKTYTINDGIVDANITTKNTVIVWDDLPKPVEVPITTIQRIELTNLTVINTTIDLLNITNDITELQQAFKVYKALYDSLGSLRELGFFTTIMIIIGVVAGIIILLAIIGYCMKIRSPTNAGYTKLR